MEVSKKKLKRKHKTFKRKQKKNWCYVYILEHRGVIFYVGQTTLFPEDRLKWHCKAVKNSTVNGKKLSPVQNKIKELLDAGEMPKIEIIDKDGMWDISEAVWIDRLTTRGERLLNVASRVKQ